MGTPDNLLFATALFVLGHFLLSSTAVRTPLISKIGDKAFKGIYSLLSISVFVWMVMSYGDAMYQPIWEPPQQFRMLTVFIMYPACILLFCALTTKSPTMVGGEEMLKDENPNGNAPRGIITVTRHPMLVATTLWSIAHLLVNGDKATMVIGIGILVLSLGGMLHIDQRRSISGEGWGVYALTTSIIPFMAALTGKTKVDWKGIGVWRVFGGTVLFGALLYGHALYTGMPLIPGGA